MVKSHADIRAPNVDIQMISFLDLFKVKFHNKVLCLHEGTLKYAVSPDRDIEKKKLPANVDHVATWDLATANRFQLEFYRLAKPEIFKTLQLFNLTARLATNHSSPLADYTCSCKPETISVQQETNDAEGSAPPSPPRLKRARSAEVLHQKNCPLHHVLVLVSQQDEVESFVTLSQLDMFDNDLANMFEGTFHDLTTDI